MAETLPPGPQRDAWLTFAFVGGGPTGLVVAGQMREMATRAMANEFHSIEPQDARVLLFDGGSCVLGSFAPALTDKATKILQNLGVELHMGVHVTDVRHDGFFFPAEAGIRAGRVTGVQTCALPISGQPPFLLGRHLRATRRNPQGGCLFAAGEPGPRVAQRALDEQPPERGVMPVPAIGARQRKIGRASCRERA